MRESYYWPALDHLGQRHVNWLLERHHAQNVWQWYHQQGYSVHKVSDVYEVPRVVVEERASRLRQRWRRWLMGESAAALFLGPAAAAVGLPILSMVLLAWSIELGWAYGLDMNDALLIDDVRRRIHRRLLPALGCPLSPRRDVRGWVRLAGSLLLWGWGPEFQAADAVMADIRQEFRHRWEIHSGPYARHSPEDLSRSRQSSGGHRIEFVE